MIQQVLMNGILAGLTWGLVGLGFSMVYSTARFFHFAYAATFLVGAYVGVSLTWLTGVPLVLSVCGAVAAATILGLMIEVFVYQPLRKSGANSLALFLASLGIVIVVENSVALLFGSEIQVPGERISLAGLHILGAQITGIQFGSAVVVLALFSAIWVFTHLTLMGKRMRAVAADTELAVAVGIDERAAVTIAILIGSALSGVSGFLLAYDTSTTPTMGFTVLLIGVTAAIIGGMGSLPGALLGGFFIGIAQHVGAWFLSAEWQEGIVFAILLVFLLVRPQGFFGKSLRKVTV